MTRAPDQAMHGDATPATHEQTLHFDDEPRLLLPAGSPPPWDEKGADIGGLVRPMLEALAKLADMEATYLTVFDWKRREQEVRFVFGGDHSRIEEGDRIPLPPTVSEESLPGVTRSPQTVSQSHPDSMIARRLGLKAFVSVPVTIARHRLYGMLCGASRDPRKVSEAVVGIFESFAGIMAGHLGQVQIEETEARAVEAEDQLLSRARFLAEAEHRMKTPLTVLLGTATTLRDNRDRLSEAARHELEQSMVRNARLLSQELESLLLEARAEVRARDLSPVDVDLGALVRQIATAFDGVSGAHQVVAEVPRPVQAFIDPDAVHQILGHLIENAIKYSPEGGTVTVQASESDGSLSIAVIDQGIGLPPAVDVFEAFRRGNPHEPGTPGIGLGLHIVRNLVEAMEGTVTARGNPGAGSTFTATLPAVAAETSAVSVGLTDAIITLGY